MYSLRRLTKAAAWMLFGTKPQRRRVLQECARVSASLFGDFQVSEDHKLWRRDSQFVHNYGRLSPGNPYSAERKFLLRELTRYTDCVSGSLAECGCYQGASAFFIASEAPDTRFHLFDSFEGLSEPLAGKDNLSADHLPWEKGSLKSNEDVLRSTLAGFNNIVVHKGWIPDRFHEVEGERFRLVHIDVDLYQPTLDALAFFYPRMSPGGVLVMDDYGFTNCAGAYDAAVEFMSDKPEKIIHVPTGQGVIIKNPFSQSQSWAQA